MAIEHFTMEDVDEEIMQIIQQQTGGQEGASGPPNIIKSIMDRVKAKRNSNNGTSQN